MHQPEWPAVNAELFPRATCVVLVLQYQLEIRESHPKLRVANWASIVSYLLVHHAQNIPYPPTRHFALPAKAHGDLTN